LASNRQELKLVAQVGDESNNTVPTVPVSSQSSFTILSPDSHLLRAFYRDLVISYQSEESNLDQFSLFTDAISQYLGQSSHLHHLNL
jgi:hypothetical protein